MTETIQNANEVEAGDIIKDVSYDERYEVVRVNNSDGSLSVKKASPYSNNKTIKKTVLAVLTVVS